MAASVVPRWGVFADPARGPDTLGRRRDPVVSGGVVNLGLEEGRTQRERKLGWAGA